MNLFGITLGTGNTKLGPVLNWSLPSLTTCPGASAWCKKYCYADRYERRRPKCRSAYENNLEMAKDSTRFIHLMTNLLPRILPCFRIHVSGDIFDSTYIKSWISVCESLPEIRFWCYSRSWVIPEWLPTLKILRDLDNVQLFASVDTTMPLPPSGWRIAWIENDSRANGITCLEQTGEKRSCLDCGYCFQENKGSVIFKQR